VTMKYTAVLSGRVARWRGNFTVFAARLTAPAWTNGVPTTACAVHRAIPRIKTNSGTWSAMILSWDVRDQGRYARVLRDVAVLNGICSSCWLSYVSITRAV
jgi:hypothetical protein